MGSINNIRKSSCLRNVSVKSTSELHHADDDEQKATGPVKLGSEEAYITSCRPTRLSMELIAHIRAKGH